MFSNKFKRYIIDLSTNKIRYDLELHMVHQSHDGKIAVIGLLYKIGKPNHFLAKVYIGLIQYVCFILFVYFTIFFEERRIYLNNVFRCLLFIEDKIYLCDILLDLP